MQQSGLRVLKGLLNWSRSMALTFLLATNQVDALTFDKAFDFQMKLAGEWRTEVDSCIANDVCHVYVWEVACKVVGSHITNMVFFHWYVAHFKGFLLNVL